MCIHNIYFPFYHLFSFRSSIVWIHTLHCLNDYERITVNTVVSELYLIRLIQYFWCMNNHIKIRTQNILFPLFHLYLFHLLILRSHNLHCLINFGINQSKHSGKWIHFNYTETLYFKQYIIIFKVLFIIFCFHCNISFTL